MVERCKDLAMHFVTDSRKKVIIENYVTTNQNMVHYYLQNDNINYFITEFHKEFIQSLVKKQLPN